MVGGAGPSDPQGGLVPEDGGTLHLPKPSTSDVSSVRAARYQFPLIQVQVTPYSPDLVTPGTDTQTQMSLLPSN